jgi:sterol 3beta-glucosyltransferase
MRIVILTVGTRGDVQPYVALGLGLQRAGHQVCVATHSLFREFVTSRGLDFAAVEGNPAALLEEEEGRAWLESGNNPLRFVRRMIRLAEPLTKRTIADCWQACQGAELIMVSVLGFLAGSHVAEKLGVPCYPAFLQNAIHTSAFPSMLAPALPLGRVYNRLSYLFVDQLLWLMIRPYVNKARREVLGLPPLSRERPWERLYQQHHPLLLGYSPSVLPKPPEWGDWISVTGYWFLDHPADWQPSADLVDFLDSGPPPVYVGFGSMNNRNPEEMTELALKSLKRSGQRGILLTGWGGLSQADLPEEVFRIESVPHDWLFPRMAAVVHHGGVGTVAAGLRAGIPSIIVPYFSDQPFWGRRVAALGVGPKPIPRARLSVERLAMAIRTAVGDPAMRARAAALGQRIRSEDGVARAVEAFQRHWSNLL